MSKFPDNDFVVVVDSALAGSVQNTPCLNNEVNTRQPTHNVSGIVDVIHLINQMMQYLLKWV